MSVAVVARTAPLFDANLAARKFFSLSALSPTQVKKRIVEEAVDKDFHNRWLKTIGCTTLLSLSCAPASPTYAFGAAGAGAVLAGPAIKTHDVLTGRTISAKIRNLGFTAH